MKKEKRQLLMRIVGSLLTMVLILTAIPAMNISAQERTPANLISVKGNGEYGRHTTQTLTLTFDVPVPFLMNSNIHISDGVEVVRQNEAYGNVYSVVISGEWENGDIVTVTVTDPIFGVFFIQNSLDVVLHRSI